MNKKKKKQHEINYYRENNGTMTSIEMEIKTILWRNKMEKKSNIEGEKKTN